MRNVGYCVVSFVLTLLVFVLFTDKKRSLRINPVPRRDLQWTGQEARPESVSEARPELVSEVSQNMVSKVRPEVISKVRPELVPYVVPGTVQEVVPKVVPENRPDVPVVTGMVPEVENVPKKLW